MTDLSNVTLCSRKQIYREKYKMATELDSGKLICNLFKRSTCQDKTPIPWRKIRSHIHAVATAEIDRGKHQIVVLFVFVRGECSVFYSSELWKERHRKILNLFSCVPPTMIYWALKVSFSQYTNTDYLGVILFSWSRIIVKKTKTF